MKEKQDMPILTSHYHLTEIHNRTYTEGQNWQDKELWNQEPGSQSEQK